jgi:hypothetical protein
LKGIAEQTTVIEIARLQEHVEVREQIEICSWGKVVDVRRWNETDDVF